MPQHRRRGRPPHPDLLTPAEWAVLDAFRHGMTRGEIAGRRRTSVDAVKYHLGNIAGKLGVATTAELRFWPGIPATSHRTGRDRPMDGTLELGPIGQVSLMARDVARAESFYRDTLGLPHIFTFGDLAFFDCAGTRLFVRAVSDEEWRPGSILYYRVDDIGAAYDALRERGVAFQGAPHLIYDDEARGVEEWMAFFEDSEGNLLALMSQVSSGASPADGRDTL